MDLTIDNDIREQFTYQNTPTEQESRQFREVSDALMFAAQVVRNNTPPSADQTLALQHLVDARMRANKAIAHGGKSFERKERQ